MQESKLWLACLSGGDQAWSEAAKLIFDDHVDVNELDIAGRPALWIACRDGNPKLAKLLLDNGAKADIQFKEKGETLLLMAASDDTTGHLEVAQMLLAKGADVNKADRNGMTPLMRACLARNDMLARLFLSYGAEKGAGLNDGGLLPKGSTAADFARLCKHELLVRLVDPCTTDELQKQMA